MKKFAFSLIAFVVLTQAIYAQQSLISPFILSLEEINRILEAIQTNPAFREVIGQNEFIVEIEKQRKRRPLIDRVRIERWNLQTVAPLQRADSLVTEVNVTPNLDEDLNLDAEEKETALLGRNRNRQKIRNYEAKVLVTPNPEIGPPLIEVLSLKRI